MNKNKKIDEMTMLARLQPGAVLLPPLVIRSCGIFSKNADASVELEWPGDPERFRFVVEIKTRATPQTIQLAMEQAKSAVKEGEWPMIQVPYLSLERLGELERQGVSGVDLCGNGVVIVPKRLCVVRSGAPNQYRDSRPLNNPYRGRSAMVARMLLQRPKWESLSELAAAILEGNIALSLAQVSKAVRAMQEELIVAKSTRVITLNEPLRLLDKLGSEWPKRWMRARQALRLPPTVDWPRALSSNALLKWAVTGESSVTRYAIFSEGGPRRIAVSSLPLALTLLGGQLESVANFADVELIETAEAGFFFGNQTDERGIRWASRLQTWLELQSGDARQQNASKDLREQILKDIRR